MYTEKELTELEQFFQSSSLPKEIRLSQSEVVTDVPVFIKNSLAVCRANPGLKTFEAAFDRLVKLKELLLGN